jgi:cell division protein FtsW
VTSDSKLLVLIMYALIAIGVVMIYSASAVHAEQAYDDATYFLWHQLVAVLLGTLIFLISFSMNPELLRRYSRLIMGLAIVLLLLVFLPLVGRAAGGAQRWIQLPFFNFQPVEYAKLAICIYLADYLARKRKLIVEGSIVVFGPPLAITCIVGVLVMAQPDLGSCVFFFMMVGILFFLSGIRLRYILLAAAAAGSLITFLIISEPYRMKRVVAYLDPWKDPQGSGFQIIQSFLAFGLGGVQGVGLGQSTQKLFYLPQSHTDFVFSIIGEELGLLGTFSVVGLYVLFFYFGNRVASRARDPFMRLLAYALILLVILQALMNLLVTVGLIPTKGLPLPFVSYGGSALIFHMAAVGILIAIDRASSSYLRAS